jgi:hypothetical protein
VGREPDVGDMIRSSKSLGRDSQGVSRGREREGVSSKRVFKGAKEVTADVLNDPNLQETGDPSSLKRKQTGSFISGDKRRKKSTR